MGCCDNFVKWFLLLTNLILFLLSLVILSLAIWVLVDKPSLLNILDETSVDIPTYGSVAILFLVVSIASLVVSFFGCCGAYKESRCMLGTYFLAVLCELVIITVAAAIGLTQGVDALGKPLLDSLALYDSTSTRVEVKEVVALWDQVQSDLHCCGVYDAGDWEKNNPRYGYGTGFEESGNAILMNVMVPKSCCTSAGDKAVCQVTPSGKNGAYVTGCFTLVVNDISDHINVVGGIAIAIIVIMVLDLIIALYMCTCSLSSSPDDGPRPKKRNYVRPGYESRA